MTGEHQRDLFLDLIGFLHQNTEGRRWMACLQFYIDESGHVSQHPFVVVAGFMGLEAAWTGFSNAWNDILQREGVIAPFHMTDFEAKEDQFAKPEWTEPKRRRLLGALMKEITERQLCMIGAAISTAHFKALDWSIYPGYKKIDPYMWAMQDVLWRAINVSQDADFPTCNGDRIFTVLARQREADTKRGKDPKGAADAYYRATALFSGHDRLASTATMGSQIEFPQLQAADIAAFEFRWKLTRSDLNRWPWQQITKTRRVFVGGRGIDPLAIVPTDGESYQIAISSEPRPIDVILEGAQSKARRNQGKRTTPK